MKDVININADALMPISDSFKTQIILQRHCNYSKENGNLVDESVEHQKEIVLSFLQTLESQNLENIYFLFVASNTNNSSSEQKRSVDTTNIVMKLIQSFFESKGISKEHIINLDETLNYGSQIKQTKNFSEPWMFTDSTGYLEFLKEKNNGIGKNFWLDFEEDKYKQEREELNAEGPDEIVARGVRYINVLRRFSNYFHTKKPNNKLIIWCGTHYDLISPLAKQTIFDYDKTDEIYVENCGGISFEIDASDNIIVNVNGQYYPVHFENIKQHHRHL